MPSVDQDITWHQGDSGTIRIPIFDSAGAAINLTGATAKWWLARSRRTLSADAWVKKTTVSGIALASETVDAIPNVWVATITLASADTESLPYGIFYHELEITYGAGNISTVTTGSFTLTRTVVRVP